MSLRCDTFPTIFSPVTQLQFVRERVWGIYFNREQRHVVVKR